MTWCRHCSASAETITSPNDDDDDGGRKRRGRISGSGKSRFTSCSSCGRVLKDRSIVDKALSTIHDIAAALDLSDSTLLADAHSFFRTAMQRDKDRLFFRSRRSRTHTAACCLYVALRRHRKPCMLIDLSDHLRVSVYVLGAVFVALSKILSHDSSSILMDPSLFMHRFSTRLLKRKDAEVASAASRIFSRVTRGDRSWMVMKRSRNKEQTQVLIRLCSAALYVALNPHEEEEEGRNLSKSRVLGVVLAEFESLDCESGLSVEEFVSMAAELGTANDPLSKYGTTIEEELACRHRDSGRAHFCNGLCTECYKVFLEISEGREPSESRKKRRTKCGREWISLRGSSSGVSDIEGRDICSYLNTEKEKLYRTTIWELMNKDYLDDQSAKVRSIVASLDARTSGVNKSRKERKRRRANDATGAEDTKKAQMNKKLSSRINYDVLSQLHEEEEQQKTGADIVVIDELKGKNRYNEEFDTGDGDNCDEDGDSAVAEEDEYFGDLEEDYPDGDYNECFTDGNEECTYDDLGF